MGKIEEIKVLIVDNEKVFASSLADHLISRGLAAQSVYSGKEALAYAPQFQPDVMVLDLRMPDMTGLDVLAQIKGMGLAVEVILLTGESSFDIGIACMELGAFDYIIKPVDLDQLLDIIGQAFRKKMGH